MQTPFEDLARIFAIDATILGLATGMIDGTLNTFEVIVVAVDTGGRGELTLLDIDSFIPLAIARSSLLVALVARQRTCAGLASWASILGLFREATRVSTSGVEMNEIARDDDGEKS